MYFILLHLMYSRRLQFYLVLLYSADTHDCCPTQDKTGFRTEKGRTVYFRSKELCYIMKRIRDSSVTTVTRLRAGYPAIRL